MTLDRVDRVPIHVAYRPGTRLAATYPGCVRLDDGPPDPDGPWTWHDPQDCPGRPGEAQAQAVDDLARAAENEPDADLAVVYRVIARAAYTDRDWLFDSESDSLIGAVLRHARRHHPAPTVGDPYGTEPMDLHGG